MKIPQSEMDKMRLLQSKLDRLEELEEETHYYDQHAEKIGTMIQGCSRKLVKFDAKIMFEKLEHRWSSGVKFCLTREGLKERFGGGIYNSTTQSYGESMMKARNFSNPSWICSLQYTGDDEHSDIVSDLKKIRKHKAVNIPEGIDRLIECIEDFRKLNLVYNRRYGNEGQTIYEHVVNLPQGIIIQADPDNRDSEDREVSHLVFLIGKRPYQWGTTESLAFGASLKNARGEDRAVLSFDFNHKIDFNEYVRVSEPEVFDILIATMDKVAGELEEKIKTDTKEIVAFEEKWGVYASIKEL